MPLPAVEIRKLTKQFRVRHGWFKSRILTALEDVSFSVLPGEAFGLIGRNGSGKSTLLRVLSTILIPTAGQAWMNGIPVSSVRSIKGLVGVIPPIPCGFSGELTGRQNLEFFAVLQRLEPAAIGGRVEQLLERVGIADLGSQPFWTYSTGQRQRLNIARALLHDPPILLFDEPTRSLDPWAAREIRSWIKDELIRRRSKTLLVASNQAEEVAQLCDRIAFLRNGKTLFTGSAREAQEFSAADLC